MCAAVIHTPLSNDTRKPWRKNFPGARRAMTSAQMTKMTSQNRGSTLDGMTNTVATHMAAPNKDKAKISFQFIGAPSVMRHRACAAMRFCMSSGDTSSLWVAICQMFPKGSLNMPQRSLQNMSATGDKALAPVADMFWGDRSQGLGAGRSGAREG